MALRRTGITVNKTQLLVPGHGSGRKTEGILTAQNSSVDLKKNDFSITQADPVVYSQPSLVAKLDESSI